MTMASLMKELYIALGVIVVIAAGVFFLWRRHRKNAAKALQVSSSKTAVEKRTRKVKLSISPTVLSSAPARTAAPNMNISNPRKYR